jgi:hypothetical protein
MVDNTLSQYQYWYSFVVGATQSIVQQLPWDQLSPDLMRKFKVNGMRLGQRSTINAQQLYDMRVPTQIKALGESSVRNFLNGKDASHIRSHANGGNGNAENIIFEHYKSNRARGSTNMNQSEFSRIQASNHFEFLRSPEFYKKVGNNTVKGMFYGALFSASTSAFTNIWNAIDDEVSWETAAWNIANAAKDGAIAGGIAGFGITVLSIACPPIGGIVSAVSPFVGLLGAGTTVCNLVGFAIDKFFPKNPQVSLILKPKPKAIELLEIPEPIKLFIPPKIAIYAPKIVIPKVDLYFPPKHPLVYSLETE